MSLSISNEEKMLAVQNEIEELYQLHDCWTDSIISYCVKLTSTACGPPHFAWSDLYFVEKSSFTFFTRFHKSSGGLSTSKYSYTR